MGKVLGSIPSKSIIFLVYLGFVFGVGGDARMMVFSFNSYPHPRWIPCEVSEAEEENKEVHIDRCLEVARGAEGECVGGWW
jgi:hypothetical protein